MDQQAVLSIWYENLFGCGRSMARWKAENETIQNGAHQKYWSYSASALQDIQIGFLEGGSIILRS